MINKYDAIQAMFLCTWCLYAIVYPMNALDYAMEGIPIKLAYEKVHAKSNREVKKHAKTMRLQSLFYHGKIAIWRRVKANRKEGVFRKATLCRC